VGVRVGVSRHGAEDTGADDAADARRGTGRAAQ
jgi:hypothetical protein